MLPAGTGQFIAGVGYVAATRTFDQWGHALPAPTFRKSEAIGYIEYGVSDTVDLVIAPTLARAHDGASATTVTGSNASAIGGRLALYRTSETTIALQVLVQPPLGSETMAMQLADGGATTFATDVRLPIGRSFSFFGRAAFIDLEPGVRLRASPWQDEARLDASFGVMLVPRLMMMLQSFSSFSGPSGLLIPRTDWTKVQGSLVYELSPRWSVQVGALSTVSGLGGLYKTSLCGHFLIKSMVWQAWLVTSLYNIP